MLRLISQDSVLGGLHRWSKKKKEERVTPEKGVRQWFTVCLEAERSAAKVPLGESLSACSLKGSFARWDFFLVVLYRCPPTVSTFI